MSRCLLIAIVALLPLQASCSNQPKKQELDALRLELKSLSGVLDTDIDVASSNLQAIVALATAKNDVDEMLRGLRLGWSEVKAACTTANSRMDQLEAFIVRHQDVAAELNLAAVRSHLARKRGTVTSIANGVAESLQSIRDTHCSIKAKEEWQRLTLEVKAGDCLIVVPKGSWTIGDFAGSCTGQGMNNAAIQG